MKKKIRNLFVFILIGVVAVFTGERVDALACQYTVYYHRDATEGFNYGDHTIAAEYRVTLSVVDDVLVVTDFESRQKRNDSWTSSYPPFDSNGWTAWGWTDDPDSVYSHYDKGNLKALEGNYHGSEETKKYVVETMKEGSCPYLEFYYEASNKDHFVHFYDNKERCDKSGWFGWTCSRGNFRGITPTIIYEDDETPACPPSSLFSFQGNVSTISADITRLGDSIAKKISDITLKNYTSTDAVMSTAAGYINEFSAGAQNYIDDLWTKANGYHCSEVTAYLKGILADDGEITALINDNLDKLYAARDGIFDNKIQTCGTDAECVQQWTASKETVGEYLERAEEETKDTSNEVYDKLTGAFFEPIASNDCEIILADVLDLIKDAFNIIKIAAPILLIFFGTMDFGKAVIANDDKAIKKATGDFAKRTIAAVAIFFIPFFIELIFGLPGVELGIENIICGISKVVFR